MKLHTTLLLSTLAFGASALVAIAQDAPPENEDRGGDRPRRPAPPLVAALDANKDGEIDASEIAKASDALKSLDKNSDGKLTRDELRPARREGGPDGPRGGGEHDGKGKHDKGPKPDAQ